MRSISKVRTLSSMAGVTVAGVLSVPAPAANAEFQNFFFNVCKTPGGALGARCAQTTGGLGNVSGDSESSLNPSQNLAHSFSSTNAAVARSKEVHERSEKMRDEDAPAANEAVKVDVGPFSLLINVSGSQFKRKWEDTEVAAGARRLEGDNRAFEVGIDYRYSDQVVFGAMVGVEKTDYEFDPEAPGRNFTPAARAGDAEGDNRFFTVFGSWAFGEGGYADLAASIESSDGSYRRNSVFQESNRVIAQTDVRVSGEASGSTNWFSLNAGYDFSMDATTFGPFVGVIQTRSKIDAYDETDLSNSGLAMRFGGTTRKSTLGHVGFRASHAVSSEMGVFLPQLRIELQREFKKDPAAVEASFLLDPSQARYALSDTATDRQFLSAGISLTFVSTNGWMIFGDVSALSGNDNLDRTRVTLGLRKEF